MDKLFSVHKRSADLCGNVDHTLLGYIQAKNLHEAKAKLNLPTEGFVSCVVEEIVPDTVSGLRWRYENYR